jgi:hypothetical protein
MAINNIFLVLRFFKSCGNIRSAPNPTKDENEMMSPINSELLTDDWIKAGTQSLNIPSPT